MQVVPVNAPVQVVPVNAQVVPVNAPVQIVPVSGAPMQVVPVLQPPGRPIPHVSQKQHSIMFTVGMAMTLLMWGLMFGYVYLSKHIIPMCWWPDDRHSKHGTQCPPEWFGIHMLMIVVPYMVYLNECRISKWRRYLQNMTADPTVFASYIVEVCAFAPEALTMHVSCSHTETTYSTDSDGKQTSSTHTVVTHASDHVCSYTRLEDTSDFSGMSLPEVQAASAHWSEESSSSLLEIDSKWTVSSPDGSLDKVKADLHNRHKHLDQSCNVSIMKSEPACFKAEQCLKIHEAGPMLSIDAYWLFSIFLLTMPYRWYFERCSGTLSLEFQKSVHNLTENSAAPGSMPGQVLVTPGAPMALPVQVPSSPDPMKHILQLKGLLDAGAITQAEYDAKKAEALKSM